MSKTKTNAEMLVCIKQCNKTARETRAVREGFATSADLILWLEAEIKAKRGNKEFVKGGTSPMGTTAPVKDGKKGTSVKKTTPTTTTGTPTIHVADVLDNSGSMYGPKSDAAIKGINAGIEGLRKDTAKVNYTYTLCDFSDDIIFRYLKVPLSAVGRFSGATRGSTALFDAIGKTIEHIKPAVKPNHKVLVNIYTDGQENSSRNYTAEAISTLIKTLSGEGWTFTFIGTAADVAYAQSRLSIKESNTLVYDGTASGLEKSINKTLSSRTAYSASVSRGEDVSEGFYKDLK